MFALYLALFGNYGRVTFCDSTPNSCSGFLSSPWPRFVQINIVHAPAARTLIGGNLAPVLQKKKTGSEIDWSPKHSVKAFVTSSLIDCCRHSDYFFLVVLSRNFLPFSLLFCPPQIEHPVNRFPWQRDALISTDPSAVIKVKTTFSFNNVL